MSDLKIRIAVSGWAYIEAKNKYGEKVIENFEDDATCETWLYYYRELLLQLGFSEKEIITAWKQW
jgi:hypothetical protein